jgi:nicotinamidase-related amidase
MASESGPMRRGRGGLGFDPRKTAVLFIEVQNEFMTPGGKLHESVRPNMEAVNMLPNCVRVVAEVRKAGGAVQLMIAPITFAADSSDNPNRHLGILSGIDYNELFTCGSWNAEISSLLIDPSGNNDDITVVQGKKGLSAFVGTDLEEQLQKGGIETIALAGFMANCCVESTMRDAFDRGYNVITLTDCVATTTMRGYKSCVEITYPFFSTPMNCDSFLACLRSAMKLPPSFIVKPLRDTVIEFKTPPWASRHFLHEASSGKGKMGIVEDPSAQADVYQVGPWFCDVRQSAIGEKTVLRSGEQELKRYLAMGESMGGFGGKSYDSEPGGCDCIYSEKLKRLRSLGDALDVNAPEESFGWFCNMTVVRLPGPEGGCLVYSPVLGNAISMWNVPPHTHTHTCKKKIYITYTCTSFIYVCYIYISYTFHIIYTCTHKCAFFGLFSFPCFFYIPFPPSPLPFLPSHSVLPFSIISPSSFPLHPVSSSHIFSAILPSVFVRARFQNRISASRVR